MALLQSVRAVVPPRRPQCPMELLFLLDSETGGRISARAGGTETSRQDKRAGDSFCLPDLPDFHRKRLIVCVSGGLHTKLKRGAATPLRKAKFVEGPRIPDSELGSPTHPSSPAETPVLDPYCPDRAHCRELLFVSEAVPSAAGERTRAVNRRNRGQPNVSRASWHRQDAVASAALAAF
ncbi:hypothetical protein COCON_G00210250 [Conger conger]|uniref:Uncharacterized protein n=1 Tax=Conger conger TaxID=82655 RepID=A0A9Q1D0K3_CONCO|nr:hypothetical protein COCON_G00210250 [Conger conger]